MAAMIEHYLDEQCAKSNLTSRKTYSSRAVTSAVSPFLAPSVSRATLLLGGLIIFSPLMEGGTTHFPVLIMRLTLVVAVVAWTISQMRLNTIILARNCLNPILLVFLGLVGFSIWLAPYKNPSVQWLMSIVMYVALFGVVLQGVRSSQQIWQISMVIVSMGVVEAGLGIAQYLWLAEFRSKGTFFNPNFFATYEVVTLSVLLGLLSGVQNGELNRWQWAFLWSAVGIMCAAFVMAQSRGALLALVVAMIFIGCARFGGRALIVVILSLLAGAVIPNPLQQRVQDVSVQDPYAYSRMDIWKSSFDRVVDRPLGAGLGMYKYTSFQFRFPIESNIVRYGKRAESAHNEYLQMAVELGVGGLALFVIGALYWAREVKATLGANLESWERGLVTGLSGGVVAILAHGTVDSIFHEPALVILLIVCGGSVLALQIAKKPGEALLSVPFPYHPIRVALTLAFGGILAVLATQPAAGWYAHARGQDEAMAGRPGLALKWFQLASRIDPGVTGYHDDVARISVQHFKESGDPKWLILAVEEEDLAIKLNPMDGRFPYRLGTIYSALAELNQEGPQRDNLRSEAARAYQQAIRTDPYTPMSYLALANIRLSEGQREEAKSWLLRAVSTEPNFLPARAALAELSLKSGDLPAAQLELETIASIKRKYERRILSDLERQFLDVDLESMSKALASRFSK